GLALVVAVDDLDLEPADLAPQVIERQLDGILHVLADDAGRARERGDEPDIDGLGGAGDLAREQPRHETENHAEPQCTHADLLRVGRERDHARERGRSPRPAGAPNGSTGAATRRPASIGAPSTRARRRPPISGPAASA